MWNKNKIGGMCMKKCSIAKIILVLFMLLSLSMFGCGSSSGDGYYEPPIEPPTKPPTSTPTEMYIHLKATTFDKQENILDMKEQVVAFLLKDKLPSQLNAYETFAGVQIEMLLDVPELLKNMIAQLKVKVNALIAGLFNGTIKAKDIKLDEILDLENVMSDVMGSVKQTPLLLQFWALEQMKSSNDKGVDGKWFTKDDVIDPIYGYFDTVKKEDGTYEQTLYSDFGQTPKGKIVYELVNGLKFKAYSYDKDGVLNRVTTFKYNDVNQMIKAVNRDADGNKESVYEFTYDNSKLQGMRSYDANGSYLGGGSYSKLTWGENTLHLELGLQVNINWIFSLLKWTIPETLAEHLALIKPIDLRFMTFDYVFSPVDPKVIVSSVEYSMLKKPLPENIDTQYEYFYDGLCATLSGGTTYDWSKNLNVNNEWVTTTKNELTIENRKIK